MDLAHMGMDLRTRYEVSLYHMTKYGEDLKDWVSADGYRDAVKKAKELSKREDITSVAVVKNIDYYYPDKPEDIWDTIVEKRWEYRNGKLTGTFNF